MADKQDIQHSDYCDGTCDEYGHDFTCANCKQRCGFCEEYVLNAIRCCSVCYKVLFCASNPVE